MLAAIIVPKLIHEYFQHFLLHQPWELYDIGGWLGLSGVVQEYANYFSWGGLFYILPLALFLLFFKKVKF